MSNAPANATPRKKDVKYWIYTLIGLFFTPGDPRTSQVMDLAVRGARIYSLSFLASGFNIVQSGYHTALGDALRSVAIAASRGIVFLPVSLALFSALLGVDGVWLAPPFAEAVTVLVCLLLHRPLRPLS